MFRLPVDLWRWLAWGVLIVVVLLLLLLSSCEGGYIVVTATPDAPPTPTAWITNTAVPTADPTPTQEGPHWSVACLPDGVVPIHPNACPDNYQVLHWTADSTQEIPELFGLDIELYPVGITKVPNADVVNGAMRLHVYYFAGEFEIFIPGLELTANHCYTFNVPMAIDMRGASSRDNFTFTSHIYTDRGDVFDLNNHPVIQVTGDVALEVGEFPDRLHWEFMPSRDMTIEWSVEYVAQWATAGAGNFVDFQAFYIQEQDNTTLCR